MKFFSFLALILVLFACQKEDVLPEVTPSPSVLTFDSFIFNLSYGLDDQQVMDVSFPAAANDESPLVVLVHGGGWLGGDKSEINYYKELIQENFPTWIVINVNYRLCSAGQPIIDEQLQDIQDAIQLFKTLNTNWNGKIIVFGYSAGAHLATLHATAHANVSPVDGIVNLLGHVDFTIPNYINSNLTNNYLENVFGTTSYIQDPTLWVARSPITYLTVNTPPVFSVYCGLDQLVPAIQGERFREQLNQLQVDNEYLYFPNENHFDWTPETNQELNARLIEFLRRF